MRAAAAVAEPRGHTPAVADALMTRLDEDGQLVRLGPLTVWLNATSDSRQRQNGPARRLEP